MFRTRPSRRTGANAVPRSRSLAVRGSSKTAVFIAGVGLEFPPGVTRPVTRGDCVDGARPCPWAGCKYNTYLDVDEKTGTIKLNFPHLDILDVAHSCVLDQADAGELTLEEVGQRMNVTRERVRQIETKAMKLLKEQKNNLEDIPEKGTNYSY